MHKFFRSKLFLVLATLAIVVVSVGVFRTIMQNRSLADEVAALEEESSSLQKKNSEFSELLKRFQTTAFLEREARLKFNLQKPGEQVIAIREEEGSATSTKPVRAASKQTHLDLWWRYFFATAGEDSL